jgi:hypothetical protein
MRRSPSLPLFGLGLRRLAQDRPVRRELGFDDLLRILEMQLINEGFPIRALHALALNDFITLKGLGG